MDAGAINLCYASATSIQEGMSRAETAGLVVRWENHRNQIESLRIADMDEVEVPLTYPKPSATHAKLSKESPFIIGVAGGASSGKKEACRMIMDRLMKTGLANRVITIR